MLQGCYANAIMSNFNTVFFNVELFITVHQFWKILRLLDWGPRQLTATN